MPEPFETYVDAEEVAASAADLALRAEELRAGLSGPVARIREINAEEPWGHDEAGSAFRASYLGASTEDGDAVESIMAGSEDICDNVYGLAEDTGVGALTTRLVDESSGDEIPRLLAQFEENREQIQEVGDEIRQMGAEPAQAPPVLAAPGPMVVAEPSRFTGRSVPTRSGPPLPRHTWAHRMGASRSAIGSAERVRQALAARWAARSVTPGDAAEPASFVGFRAERPDPDPVAEPLPPPPGTEPENESLRAHEPPPARPRSTP